MPTAKEYTFKRPDGTTFTFLARDDMAPDKLAQLAEQENKIQSGKIPTTQGGGVQQSWGDTIADNANLAGNVTTGAGMALGQPWVAAAGPLVGRATQALGEKIAGRDVTVPTATELATDAGLGAAMGFGPAWLEQGGKSISSLARMMPKTDLTVPQVGMKWLAENVPVGKIASYLTPEAVNTGLEGASSAVQDAARSGAQAVSRGASTAADAVSGAAKSAVDTAIRMRGGVSSAEAADFFAHLRSGYSSQVAAKLAGQGDPTKISTLLTLAIRNGFKP